jgi:hypothetical protein
MLTLYAFKYIYSQIFSFAPEFELGILELKELTASADHVIHPSSDSLCAEVSILIADEAATFGFVGHEVVFAWVKLLVEGRFLVLVYPDKGDWVVLIDLKKGFQLVFQKGLGTGGGEKDEAKVGGTLTTEALLTVGLVG